MKDNQKLNKEYRDSQTKKYRESKTKKEFNFFVDFKEKIAKVYKKRTAPGQKTLVATYNADEGQWHVANKGIWKNIPNEIKQKAESIAS
ncbi:hypothetical protein IKW73_01405 [Candidatus Saccharibacteria bacterium]|nr:hypothetical protein [Candidatus Saccharibacteria bacterium]